MRMEENHGEKVVPRQYEVDGKAIRLYIEFSWVEFDKSRPRGFLVETSDGNGVGVDHTAQFSFL